MRSGRGLVLGLQSEDPVLGWIGPVGLALAVGTALIIDLAGPRLGRTLAEIHLEGPRLDELSPGRPGVATISAGPIGSDALQEVVPILVRSWPAVIVRSDGGRWPGPSVPYRAIYPGILGNKEPEVSVWQPARGANVDSRPGVIMPQINSRSTIAMLDGRLPTARRWVQAWQKVWSLPWA